MMFDTFCVVSFQAGFLSERSSCTVHKCIILLMAVLFLWYARINWRNATIFIGEMQNAAAAFVSA
jgi:hypothetical protein